MVDLPLCGGIREIIYMGCPHGAMARLKKASVAEPSQRQQDEADLTEHIRDSR